MENLITAIIVTLLAIGCCVISILQFREKGILFNNEYIFASKQEREKMDKKPHYRQSGVVFAFLAIIFLCLAVEIMTKTGWLLNLIWILSALVIIYAIVSSIKTVTKN